MLHELDDLRDCMAQTGIIPPATIEADGNIHRFPTKGKGTDDAGWYVVHSAYTGRTVRYYGAFGDWRTGMQATWVSAGLPMTFREREQLRALVARQKQERNRERFDKYVAGMNAATSLLDSAGMASVDHPYLLRKRIRPVGGIQQCGDVLLIPMCAADGTAWNVQEIRPDGSKKYGRGRAAGLSYWFADANPLLSNRVIICEGYATAASANACHLGSEYVVAFSAGQLVEAARVAAERRPGAEIVILADNDCGNPENVGLQEAKRAAAAVGGRVLVPKSADGSSVDFNDLWAAHGERAVAYLTTLEDTK